MRRTRQAGENILGVLAPAVVHTGSVEHICQMIRAGFLQILFAGNALATHDIEQALYGTSLGVWLDRGLPAEEGHEHHLRAINTIRRAGGIRAAVDHALLKTPTTSQSPPPNIPSLFTPTIFPTFWPAAFATTGRSRMSLPTRWRPSGACANSFTASASA